MSTILNREADRHRPILNSTKDCLRDEKINREHLTEGQIDDALKDTFPASDPPAWY